jgi:replication factor C large subunit
MKDTVKPWTTKYLPKKAKEVVGQDKAVAELKQFVVNFKKEKKKAAVIYGPTGGGKTCAVYALAHELGLEIVELNASDFRTADNMSAIVGTASKQMSLFFKGKIILVDEVDGVSGNADRGGILELGKLIEGTAFPIIMTANDPFDKKFSELRKSAALIEFAPLQNNHVAEILKKITDAEGIKCDEDILKAIARRAAGDARAAINDLQMLSPTGKITKDDLASLSDREKKEEITTALTKIFKTTDPLIAKQSFDTVTEDLHECISWVDENLPKEYEKAADLARAYDFVSKADIMNRRIMRWQHWRFLTYINDYLSAGVAVSKDEKYKKLVDYTQTTRSLKIYIANRKFQKRMAICEKLAEKTHSSKKDAVKSTYPFMKALFMEGKDRQMISKIIDELELDNEEIDYLKR